MMRRNIVRLFESRKDQLYYRIKRDYIRNVIATIPCNISSFSDVISGYSVRGYESLNPEFVDYVKSSIKVVFSESYKDPDYTESDVEKLYSEIKKDVNETIQNQE